MTCHHGVDATFCKSCRMEAVAGRKKQLKAGTHGYMIFEWRGDGRYEASNAVTPKVYRIASAAESAAHKLNNNQKHNCVSRLVCIKESK